MGPALPLGTASYCLFGFGFGNSAFMRGTAPLDSSTNFMASFGDGLRRPAKIWHMQV